VTAQREESLPLQSVSANNLQIRSVSHSYGEGPVLDSVDLDVGAGECVALMGASGSGKSTLLLAAAGIISPGGGKVVVDGQEMTCLSVDGRAAIRRNRIGLVFQFGELISELSLLDNVALAAELAGSGRREALRKAGDLLDRVGLSEFHKRRPAQVSGGQAQRAAVARGLVHRPALILADEPTGALDSENAQSVLSLLLELCAEAATSCVVATHDATVASACDRTVHMRDGRVVGHGER
jgi:putative ABC transport system ATP-binding protein